jgi:putative ABC transport system permease protein
MGILRSYFTAGVRSLAKSKIYTLINVFGLAIGLAACLALFLYVRFERSYDAWLPNSVHTYQLQTRWQGEGVEPGFGQQSPYRLAWEIKREFPQVEAVASAFIRDPIVRIDGEASIVEGAWVADPTIFDVLRLPFERGDPQTAFAQAGSAVLTHSEASRLFGDRDPLGLGFSVTLAGQDVPVRVTGILRDLPENTHLRVPMVIRLDRPVFAEQSYLFELWTSGTGVSYVRLKPGASADAINAALPAAERRWIPPNAVGSGGVEPYDSVAFSLANVRGIHLGQAQDMAMQPGNDPRRIATFSIVALLLLAISCVNFVNLTTARSSLRAREVALRKVVGARRYQLVGQFVGESIIVTGIGTLAALALLELATPFFRPYLATALDFTYFGRGGLWPYIIGLTLGVGFLSGVYPALILSRFSPIEILRANRGLIDRGGTGRLRSALVVGQFAVSIALIACTAIVLAQTSYAIGKHPGFAKEGLLSINSIFRSQIEDSTRNALIDRIRGLPGVTAVARTNFTPPLENHSARNFQRPGRPPQLIGDYYVEPGFFSTLRTPLVAGREFSREVPRDEVPPVPYEAETPEQVEAQQAFIQRGLNIVVNETAARELGWTQPADALGQTIRADLIATEAGLIPATIIGVVRDAQFRSARDALEASIFIDNPEEFREVLVRFEGDPQVVLGSIEREWRRVVQEVPLQTRFVDEAIAGLYERDVLEGQMFAFFAGLTTLVGALGLFGLAAFAAERRTKEIGIRKVLGARSRDIVRLLAWQFTKPVIIANLVAWPAAWWLMRDWLNGFSDRIPLTPLWFVAAGLLALIIALGTTATHALRVARSSPINALRCE